MANAILIPQFEPDLSGFALKEHVHSQYLTEHQSLTNYATKTYVTNQIAAIDFPDAGVLTFNGRAGAVEPKSGDYTADMIGAAPKTHSHSQYLTSHQSLENYAKKDHSHTEYLPLNEKETIIQTCSGLSLATTIPLPNSPNYINIPDVVINGIIPDKILLFATNQNGATPYMKLLTGFKSEKIRVATRGDHSQNKGNWEIFLSGTDSQLIFSFTFNSSTSIFYGINSGFIFG